MQLFAAIALSLLKSLLIVAGLMGVLFVGYLLIAEGGDSVREKLETPERLEELDEASREYGEAIGERQAESVVLSARRQSVDLRLNQERDVFENRLDEELRSIEEAAQQQIADTQQAFADSQRRLSESRDRLESRYCDSWNPAKWWSCRQVRQRSEAARERAEKRQEAMEEAAHRIEEDARQQAKEHRAQAEERFDQQSQRMQAQVDASVTVLEGLDEERQLLEAQADQIRAEKAQLREDNWLWIEFRIRWRHLLAVALLIFLAPYIRRTLWYYVGMPIVSSAGPIRLSESTPTPKSDDTTPSIECGTSQRTITVEVPPDQRLLTRIGYVQSNRQGARSEIFFDRQAPNLSYISGLVLMTRLQSQSEDDEPREVMLGTPDDPDAYLMRVDIEDHPGLVLRARHVVGVVGDVEINSTWRLSNLHAWATSQIRFITFSGTGTLILEGYGDIHGHPVEDGCEQKRMSLVVGFDTRLTYSTHRSATFLPYLVDPTREPLVVDVFEGTGTVFSEKNPSARKRHRSLGEAIAGFFLDAFRRLLGL